MKTIAFTNQKGGVGKTTSVINIGAGLALKGKSVLLIDMDPQAHLTLSLGLKAHELENTIYEALKGSITVNDAIIHVSHMDLLPASINLAAAEVELGGQPGREYLLKQALKKLKKEYDFLLIDCPPSLGIYTLNALTAADEVYIPLQTEFLALHGTGQLIQVVEIVKERLNSDLVIAGVIGTMHGTGQRLDREIIEMVGSHFGDKLFNTLIRRNVSLAEAPSYGKDIFSYKADSPGASDYADLVSEILSKQEEG